MKEFVLINNKGELAIVTPLISHEAPAPELRFCKDGGFVIGLIPIDPEYYAIQTETDGPFIVVNAEAIVDNETVEIVSEL